MYDDVGVVFALFFIGAWWLKKGNREPENRQAAQTRMQVYSSVCSIRGVMETPEYGPKDKLLWQNAHEAKCYFIMISDHTPVV